MEVRIMKLDWLIPSTFNAVTTNIDALFTELLVYHHSSERTSLLRDVRGSIVVRTKGHRGRSSVHIYKVRHTTELVAIDSSIVMTQRDIDVVADSIADFLLQNYLKGNRLPRDDQ